MDARDRWRRFNQFWCCIPGLDISLDVSRMPMDEAFVRRMGPAMARAFDEMAALEAGAIANRDENRMVGHYWLRAPDLAPSAEIARSIRASIVSVQRFADDVHAGRVRPAGAPRFAQLLCIGIGGSALGPMFVAEALGHPSRDRLTPHFLDNTDPDGIARVLAGLDGRLGETLCIVTSKSGGTPETRNAMLLVDAAYRAAGLSFAQHAVAITMPGSALDQHAEQQQWLARFEMFDWVGGRTSVTSAVGLLPAALQGLDIEAMLEGAKLCDAATRVSDPMKNPAAFMALAWHAATDGRGSRDMVVLPYKDRLLLLGRYLQQLIMESLGKRLDRDGKTVEQGLTVYGNKGSTDQHAYVQQLRDGVANFFVTFVRVLDSDGDSLEVQPGATSGDYLHGFLLGTREALSDRGRPSMMITLPRVEARSLGALIALFERAVGLYASLVNINAYDQPGVEAGKKAAATVLTLQGRVFAALEGEPRTAEELTRKLNPSGAAGDTETIYLILEHLAASGLARRVEGLSPESARFERGSDKGQG